MCCCASTYSFNYRFTCCGIMENKISPKGVFYLLMTALCWSLAGLFIRASHLTGIGFSMMSSMVAIPLSLIIHHQKLILNKRTLTVGLFQFLMSLTFIYANKLTTVANAIVLQYSSTIFVLIYQSIDLHKLPTKRQMGIIAIVFIGMALFFADSLTFSYLLGNILAIFSGACFGLQFYLNNKEDADAFSSTIYAYLFSLIVGSIYFKGLPPCKITDAFGILGYGTLTMSIGGIFLALGISCTEAFTANLICMLEVILAPLWAFIFFHETVSIISFIGATLVVGGIILNLILDFKKAAQ